MRAHLIDAFLALKGDGPEDVRLRRGVEQVLEAVARAERNGSRSTACSAPADRKDLNHPRRR